jgi:photosystem II stability/assembly factor-like uncharacterized protein
MKKWAPWAFLCLLFPSAASASAEVRTSTEHTSGQLASNALAAPLNSVQCQSADKCVAVGSLSDGLGSIATTTSDGGVHWASTPVLDGVEVLSALACSSSSTCIAVGSNIVVKPGRSGAPSTSVTRGVALRTPDRGHTWLVVPGLPKGVGRLSGVSCPTASDCMAVGQSPDGGAGVALVSSSAGRRWRSVSLPKGQLGLGLVTCTSRRACTAEGSKQAISGAPTSGERLSIITTVDGGSTWRQSSPPKWNYTVLGFPNFKGMACPTSTRCLMVGDETPGDGTPSGKISTSGDRGRTWTAATLPPGTTALNAISCATPADCVVVGGGIGPRGETLLVLLTTTDGGHTWITRSVPSPVLGFSSVSCATADACMAAGFGLPNPSEEQSVVAVTTDGGATWRALR